MQASSRYKGPVVGITGSTGKTTTRVLTGLALEHLGHVHQTQGNLNNHVGLPLTMLKMPSNSAACVLELGMNHAGEILQLARIARPTVRVILNVGPAHLQNFSSLEEVAAAKGELLWESGAGDTCILNADDPLLTSLQAPQGAKLLEFGRSPRSTVRLIDAATARGGRSVVFSLKQQSEEARAEIFSPGFHLASNACAACCIATSLGVPLKAAAASVSKYAPVGMRASLEQLGCGVQVINDAYNSNPASMAAALEALAALDCRGRKLVAAGDMLELGACARQVHEQVLSRCRELRLTLLGVAGSRFCEAAADDEQVVKCSDAALLACRIAASIRPGDAVLVKGSRAMGMEAVVHAIRAAFPPKRASYRSCKMNFTHAK